MYLCCVSSSPRSLCSCLSLILFSSSKYTCLCLCVRIRLCLCTDESNLLCTLVCRTVPTYFVRRILERSRRSRSFFGDSWKTVVFVELNRWFSKYVEKMRWIILQISVQETIHCRKTPLGSFYTERTNSWKFICEIYIKLISVNRSYIHHKTIF